MRKRFAIVIGVAAAGVMALGAQPAAAVPKYDTEVTITMDRGFLFHGWVKSEVRKCEVERRVVLLRQRPGTDARLGNTRTVGSRRWPWGDWRVNLHRAQAWWRVYAKARHKVRDQFVCLADRSPTYTVGLCVVCGGHGDGSGNPKSPERHHASRTPITIANRLAAALPTYNTRVTISPRNSCCYLGRVYSEVHKCMPGRKVVLFKQRPGADRRLGKDRSRFIHGADHQFAQWVIVGPRWEGRRLYAKVMPKRRDGFVCRADRSRIYDGTPGVAG